MSLWNGHKAALSLTFDDALSCQIENAVPEMDRRSIQGTFFAISKCPQYPLDPIAWRPAVARGHEIGSHSVQHKKAAQLNFDDAVFEARESQRHLQNHFGVPIDSFCYPFTDAPAPLQNAVKRFYKQARGGRVARDNKYITAGDDVNLYNTPCFHINEAMCASIPNMLRTALDTGAWVTLMFHGVGQPDAWDNVSSPTFCDMLDVMSLSRDRGLWIAPFGTVAENFRQHGGKNA